MPANCSQASYSFSYTIPIDNSFNSVRFLNKIDKSQSLFIRLKSFHESFLTSCQLFTLKINNSTLFFFSNYLILPVLESYENYLEDLNWSAEIERNQVDTCSLSGLKLVLLSNVHFNKRELVIFYSTIRIDVSGIRLKVLWKKRL